MKMVIVCNVHAIALQIKIQTPPSWNDPGGGGVKGAPLIVPLRSRKFGFLNLFLAAKLCQTHAQLFPPYANEKFPRQVPTKQMHLVLVLFRRRKNASAF